MCQVVVKKTYCPLKFDSSVSNTVMHTIANAGMT